MTSPAGGGNRRREHDDMLAAAIRVLPQRVVRGVARRVLEAAPTRFVVREFDGHPMVIRPGTPDETVLGRESFSRDLYLAMVPDYSVGPDDVIVHVGAHVGGFAVYLAGMAGRVFAIEACRETFNLLKANAALNGRDNIVASHLALADGRGTVTLYRSDEGNWGNSLMPHGRYEGEESVASMSLADYFDEHRISRCHLLTLNCEGAEFPILLSAPIDVLARVQHIIVRYHCDLAPQYPSEALIRCLEGGGLTCHVLPDKNMPAQRGTVVGRRSRA